jgi:AcrR family transcriptional regulator
VKAANRDRIAATAMRLFVERGFDQVSVAQVAAAAGVTEKTVFNHFPTKEDLVYPYNQDFEEALLAAVRGRAEGDSFAQAVRAFLLERYGRGLTRSRTIRARAANLAALVDSSAALRLRERDILSRYADSLGDQLTSELGPREADLRPAAAAGALIAVHRAVILEARRGLLAGEPAARLERRLVDLASDAFDLLHTGLSRLEPSADTSS